MAPTKPINARLGSYIVMLFALPFAGFGLFAVFEAIKLLRAHDWKQGPLAAIFALVFCTVGFGLIALVIFGSKKGKQRSMLETQHPDQPWLWREDWARGEVKSAGATALIFIWLFALFWNAISSAVFFGTLSQGKGGKAIYIVSIFPLAGVGLLIWAIRQTLRWRRFGESIFKMTTVPGVIGGPLAGVIRSARPVHGARQIRLRLACFKRDTSGDNTSEDLQWEDEKLFTGEVLQSGDGIPVLFNIPFDCSPTAAVSSNVSIVWRLEVRATMPGTGYAAQFEVPVFKTQQSRPDAAPLPDPAASYEKPIEQTSTPGITVQPAAEGGDEFIFAAARNKSAGLAMVVFIVIWTAAVVFMIRMKAPMFFPIAFGLFDLLLLWLLIAMLTSASRIVVNTSGIHLTRRSLFFRSKKFLAKSDIKSIQPKFTMSHGETTYYDLQAHLENGKKIGLASRILSKRKAESLAAEMERALGKQ